MAPASYTEIPRSDVPAGSFRYGQLARVEELDASSYSWLIATECSKPKNEEDNGASGFDTVLCVHFIYSSEDDARAAAMELGRNHSVTLIRPASRDFIY